MTDKENKENDNLEYECQYRAIYDLLPPWTDIGLKNGLFSIWQGARHGNYICNAKCKKKITVVSKVCGQRYTPAIGEDGRCVDWEEMDKQ